MNFNRKDSLFMGSERSLNLNCGYITEDESSEEGEREEEEKESRSRELRERRSLNFRRNYLEDSQLSWKRGLTFLLLFLKWLSFFWLLGPLKLIRYVRKGMEESLEETILQERGSRIPIPDCREKLIQRIGDVSLREDSMPMPMLMAHKDLDQLAPPVPNRFPLEPTTSRSVLALVSEAQGAPPQVYRDEQEEQDKLDEPSSEDSRLLRKDQVEVVEDSGADEGNELMNSEDSGDSKVTGSSVRDSEEGDQNLGELLGILPPTVSGCFSPISGAERMEVEEAELEDLPEDGRVSGEKSLAEEMMIEEDPTPLAAPELHIISSETLDAEGVERSQGPSEPLRSEEALRLSFPETETYFVPEDIDVHWEEEVGTNGMNGEGRLSDVERRDEGVGLSGIGPEEEQEEEEELPVLLSPKEPADHLSGEASPNLDTRDEEEANIEGREAVSVLIEPEPSEASSAPSLSISGCMNEELVQQKPVPGPPVKKRRKDFKFTPSRPDGQLTTLEVAFLTFAGKTAEEISQIGSCFIPPSDSTPLLSNLNIMNTPGSTTATPPSNSWWSNRGRGKKKIRWVNGQMVAGSKSSRGSSPANSLSSSTGTSTITGRSEDGPGTGTLSTRAPSVKRKLDYE